jgi:hypothetical protein
MPFEDVYGIGYGLGLFLEEYAGVPQVAHPGALSGYVA